MNPSDSRASPSDSGAEPTGLIARHPWVLVVVALALFIGGSVAALMIAIANPPVLLR